MKLEEDNGCGRPVVVLLLELELVLVLVLVLLPAMVRRALGE